MYHVVDFPASAEFPPDEPPSFVVVQDHALAPYTNPPDGLVEILKNRYELIAKFIASDPAANNLYDRQDAFYLPLRGFRGVERPGPNLYVFRLKKSQ